MMGQEGVARKHDEDEPEFLKLATQETYSRRQSIGQIWLMLWVFGALVGAIVIGQCLATGEWPWTSLDAARKWTGAPVCIAVMLRLETDLSGSPLRLFVKLLAPVLGGVAFGWAGYSEQVANWVLHVVG